MLTYVRSSRRRNPDATPEELVAIIRKRYLALATTGGAAVGATVAVPGIGTMVALGVATAETAGFLELTALFAQAISEIHGLPVNDPARANALVLGLMLGQDGKNLVQRFGKKSVGPEALLGDWGATLTKPAGAGRRPAGRGSRGRRSSGSSAAKAGGSLFGRLLPFGIGAVIGGVVNAQMSRKVANESKTAFGAAPTVFPLETDPQYVAPKSDNKPLGTLRHVAALVRKKDKDSVDGEVVDEGVEHDATKYDSDSSVSDSTKPSKEIGR